MTFVSFIRLKYIYTLLLCGVFYIGISQPNIIFSSFFGEKKLSSLNISCFYQDHKGFMWIGTQDGLNFFNGKIIKIYKHDYQDTNSLPDNSIGSITEDRVGNLWVGTSAGISRLDPATLRFKNYYRDKAGNSLGYKVNVYVDKDDQVWCFAGLLYKYDKMSDQFVQQQLQRGSYNGNKPHRLITGLFQDSEKRYWLSTDVNLFRFFPDKVLIEPYQINRKPIYFFPVKEIKEKELICGTWGNGLFRIRPENKSLDTLTNYGINGCYEMQYLKDRNYLWHGNTLSSINLLTGKQRAYAHDPANPLSNRKSEVNALFTDAQNQLWIGYAEKGIQLVTPSNQIFSTYTIADKEHHFPLISCFAETSKFRYVGGWYGSALVKIDSSGKVIKAWNSLVKGVVAENNISDAWFDNKETLWLSSSYGLIAFNERTEESKLFKLDTALTKRSHFLQILPEGDSVLWLSGYFCGLSRFSIKTHKFENWGAKIHSLYWGLAKDASGMIWLADNSGTLTGFDPVKKTFVVKEFHELTEHCIYNSIIYNPKHNSMWIGSNNGLLQVNMKDFKARLYTEKDNLPTNQINSLQFDEQDRLWIATNKGLCFYDPVQQIFKTLVSGNGLPSNILNQMFKITAGGELYIGCSDGFSMLQTKGIRADTLPWSVTITNVFSSGLPCPINTKQQLKFVERKYNQNDLQIEFASNDLINSEDNQLLYKLEGFDNDWKTSQEGLLNYSQLAPGTYTLHVTGINHSGLRPKADDFLKITILPPFWKTTWFVILVTLGSLVITALIARYVFTRNLREKILILEKEQAIEKERSRISRDMHDELGSGLTKISIMSEVAIRKIHKEEQTTDQLKTISNTSRELVDSLQDIIWVLNSKHDTLESLCAYLREYSYKYFDNSDVNVQVIFPENLPQTKLTEDQRRNILLVFKESFNNITKHSAAKGVSVQLGIDDKRISFEISDNGNGFDMEKIRSFANGLHNMKKRMQDIQGDYTILSEPNKGTRTSLSFPYHTFLG